MKTFLRVLWRGLLVILCGVFLGVFIFAAYQLYHTFHGYRQAEKEYDNLSAQYVSTPTPEASQTPTPTPEATQAPTPTPEVASGPIQVDFAALQARNNEVIGWIYSPNTKINYPIAYTDNNFYYIDHIPPDTVNANGTIFIDCRNASDFSDQNTCIYGHNMNDGSMFATLRNYREADYYTEHPVMYISTPDFNYRVDLVAGFVTEPTSFAYAGQFESEEQFAAHIELCKDKSTFESDVEVGPKDKIVTLSTCTYEIDDGRYVVVGKLTQIH